MQVTPLYAALLGLLFLVLSLLVIRQRHNTKIALGDGGKPSLTRAIRVQANFAEYVPICLLLLIFMEARGAPTVFLHALGSALLVGRLLHAYGVSQARENLLFRVSGMGLTFAVLLLAPLWILFTYLR